MELAYFILGVIAYQVIKMTLTAINNAVIERRQKRILKLVSVLMPDNKRVTYITVDATDKRAMAKVEREIREQYGVELDAEDLRDLD